MSFSGVFYILNTGPVQHLTSHAKYNKKARKVQYTTLKTNHIQICPEQDYINKRSNPTNQPS